MRLGGVLGVLEVSWVSKKLLKPMKNQHFSVWYPLGSWAFLWPSWGFLGAPGGHLRVPWGALGASWERPGKSPVSLGPSWGDPGGVLWASWAVLEACWARLGVSLAVLGCLGGVLGLTWSPKKAYKSLKNGYFGFFGRLGLS